VGDGLTPKKFTGANVAKTLAPLLASAETNNAVPHWPIAAAAQKRHPETVDF